METYCNIQYLKKLQHYIQLLITYLFSSLNRKKSSFILADKVRIFEKYV